ncbi:MAG: hypothetical protein RL100_194 [Actinomycetota bacterium]|jgi:hypothetical protein
MANLQKIARGVFYTTDAGWLNEPVRKFLSLALLSQNAGQSAASVLDPFAGDGHLLELVGNQFQVATFGLDIAGDKWPRNDSLVAIPNANDAVIVTNPPYLANHSAKRKGVSELVAAYFDGSEYDNLYKLALDRCLASADYVVAIIPETFLLSTFDKSRLWLASVIESELFSDTEAPAVVACFGPEGARNFPEFSSPLVYRDEKLIGDLAQILALRTGGLARSTKRAGIICNFNEPSGRIGLRAVDSADGNSPIAFLLAKDFDYPTSKVLHSSRLMTYLDVPQLSDAQLPLFIGEANRILNLLREESADIVLAPFKGNDKNGKRRRRLDYAFARQILNSAISVAPSAY